MSCEECIGLIVISITSLLIGTWLLKKYLNEKNSFSLYMACFFIISGIGWLFWFLTTEWVLNIYDSLVSVLIFIGAVPQIILLLFILTFFEIKKGIRLLILGLVVIFVIIHVLLPEFRILTYLSVIIIIANVFLFLMNWQKNDDVKSLGFSIGLVLILLGEAMVSISHLILGIFLIGASIAWALTYLGILEKIKF